MPQKTEGEQLQNRIRGVRVAQNLTQQALADKVGVSRQTIIALEKGQYNPTAVLAIKLARELAQPIEELFWLVTVKES